MSGPQSCFVCANKFGIFRKQHDCKSCHRTACKSCLQYSIVLPTQGSTPQPVCKFCYNASQTKTDDGRVSPPANFKRELAKKEEIRKTEVANVLDPADERITERLQKLKESYDRKDIDLNEIQNRLQKLCASEPSVSLEELEYRLAKLKGSRPPAIRVHSIRKRPNEGEAHSSNDTSEGKQVKRLIRQYTEELFMETGGTSSMEDGFHPDQLPSNPSTDDLIELARTELQRAKEMQEEEKLQDEEIKRRLSQITDAPQAPATNISFKTTSDVQFDEEGMDEETSQLIRKIMEEDRLEQNLKESGIDPTQLAKREKAESDHKPSLETAADDEFPWCFLCNDDATIRCVTCEDLFCNTCFKVTHDHSDMKRHKTVKYVSKTADNA